MAIGDTEIIEVSNGIYARLHEGLTNAGVLVSDDGVLLIDSLRVPSFARDLIADVRRITLSDIIVALDTAVYKIWFACNYKAHQPKKKTMRCPREKLEKLWIHQ